MYCIRFNRDKSVPYKNTPRNFYKIQIYARVTIKVRILLEMPA